MCGGRRREQPLLPELIKVVGEEMQNSSSMRGGSDAHGDRGVRLTNCAVANRPNLEQGDEKSFCAQTASPRQNKYEEEGEQKERQNKTSGRQNFQRCWKTRSKKPTRTPDSPSICNRSKQSGTPRSGLIEKEIQSLLRCILLARKRQYTFTAYLGQGAI